MKQVAPERQSSKCWGVGQNKKNYNSKRLQKDSTYIKCEILTLQHEVNLVIDFFVKKKCHSLLENGRLRVKKTWMNFSKLVVRAHLNGFFEVHAS